jgi:acyl-coenzyme A synthetase/AMP-(fatty) acid ligase/aryl carrier-like protein
MPRYLQSLDGHAVAETRLPGPSENFTPIQVLRHYPRPAPDGYVPFPRTALDGSVVTRFEEQVLLHEHKIALRTANKALTYGALNVAANQLARRVLAFSESASAIVAILMDQDDDSVIPAILGVLKAGKAYTVIDPADSSEKQERYLALTGTVIAITTARRVKKLARLAHSPCHLLVAEEVDGDSTSDNLGLAHRPDNLAALFFTSGSTGEPKYIARNHLQFLHSTWLNTNTYYVTTKDRQSLLYFPGFTASVPNIYDTLLNGATLCTLNPRHIPLCDLVEWLHRERITLFNPPIGLLRGLMDVVPPNTQWPYLRLITLAGQPISGKDIRDFQSRFGADTVLLHVLAMTEAGAITQGYIDHNTFTGDTAVPVGYPVADKEIVILGDDDMPLMVGEVGQIAVTSAYISLGYWGDEVQTRQRYRQLSGDLSRRTFLTGDRGCLRPDGCLEYCGRNDFIVKVRGYRVDLAAVEAALNSHPELKSSAVVVRRRKDDEQSLIAYLVLASGTEIRIPELRTFLTKTLAHYMIPERFIRVVEMPLTANGKIDRRRLPHPTPIRPNMNTPFLSPRNDLEQQFADIWAELLELDEVGIDDNFFELGGDSITALRMLLRIEERIGHVDATAFFYRPTIASMVGNVISAAEQNMGQPPRFGVDSMMSTQKRRAWRVEAGQRLGTFMAQGPVWGEHVMPYGIGIRLQRALVTQPWLQQRLYARQLEMVHKWRTELGVPYNKRVFTVNLLANTWLEWRNPALIKLGVLDRWVTMSGEGWRLFEQPDLSCGIVIALPHAGRTITLLQHVFQLRGWETAKVIDDLMINTSTSLQRTQSRTAQLWHAQQVLRRNGVAFIAADGLQGKQSVDVSFWGWRRPFQIGAAELAVETHALFIPAFDTINDIGHVQVEITPQLTAQAGSKDDKIIELTEKYGALYAARWPQFYDSMRWHHLAYNFNLPVV